MAKPSSSGGQTDLSGPDDAAARVQVRYHLIQLLVFLLSTPNAE